MDPEQNYVLYRNIFDKVIEYVTSYKNILTTIKQEYDKFIEALKRGQKESFYLQGKLKTLTFEPTTFVYYRQRADQLKEKIKIIEKDSSKIQKELQDIRDVKVWKSKREEKVLLKKKTVNLKRPIPGMTLEQCFDMNALDKRKKLLEKQVLRLKTELKLRYVSIIVKPDYEEKMKLVLNQISKAESMNKELLVGYQKRRLVLDAITAWTKTDRRVKLSEFISEMIMKHDNLQDASRLYGDQITAEWDYLEDDSGTMKEGTVLLQCVERFNELFDHGQYEVAAVFAANCPRGILRTAATMEKFKAAAVVKEKSPPLLLYFEAIINSSTAVKHPLNAAMTLEGIQCALSHKRLDLVMHWITQQRLTFSEALGDVILDYGEKEPRSRAKCLALAQIIYMYCNVHRKAGFYDLLFLMKNCPSADLIHRLVQEWNGKPPALSMGLTVLSLIFDDHKEEGFQLLEQIHTLGEDVLENVILSDVICTLEGWTEIAKECSDHKHIDLSEKIISILKSQDEVWEILSSEEDAKLMEHVFL
uniref:Clathrin heavy chain linker domain-containing protein 1 n=1 Tax=Geotrypetes seraphini TaxID=260995 RepID=A0A6P8QAG0_GEOSA|nr:clathrin heavy chain linker domain-containing protein 1 isoform X2 [Geotrypetes seraphini]